MRITWGRGCFRLWVVATILWAGFAALQLRPQLASFGTWMQVASYALAKPASDSRRPPRLLIGASNIGASNASASNVGASNVGPADDPDTAAFVAAVQQAARFATNKTIAWFAWIVGVPAMLTLLLGLAAAWVVRGFVARGWQPARRTPLLPRTAEFSWNP
jgi:hypothetical protein